MAVQIGATTLDSRLLLQGLFDSPLVATSVKTTITGQRVITSFPIANRDLQLTTEGPNGVKFGLFTRQQLTALAAIRDAGLATTLVHGTDTFNVVIPSDGIQVSSITETSNRSNADLFSGTVNLREV